jgi:uncharacterized protein YbjT (DUF2867 family)
MRVLLLGANGFIGSAIAAALVADGMHVTAVVRDGEKLLRRLPGLEAIDADLTSANCAEPIWWQGVLSDVDAVVNAAGVLQPRGDTHVWAVHRDSPAALFQACQTAGVRRVIQISAVGVEEGQTLFARSKLAGDRKLMELDLDWTLLRPAIVVGEGSYGGTSLLRALAACPFVTPVLGDGATPLQVIHKDDLAKGIVRLLRGGGAVRQVLEPAGPQRLALETAIQTYRRWLGLPPRPVLHIGDGMAKWLARLGDGMKLDPINSTALAQFATRLTGDARGFEQAVGFRPRSLDAMLAARPAETQDLWHARLYLLRPAVRLALAAMWLVSGLVGLLADPAGYAHLIAPLPAFLGKVMGVVDLAIAGALLAGWRLKLMANLQLVLVAGYTVGLTVLAPSLWAELTGGLLKNIPILALLAVHRVLEEER